MRTAARTTKADDDPWRLGTRYRRTIGPDGQAHYEKMPLRPEDLLFPEEGDQPVYTMGHSRDCTYLEEVGGQFMEGNPGILALREHRIDFGVKGTEPLGPDISLFSGVRDWDINRGTFPVKLMRAKALLAIEVTSPDSLVNDLELKVDLYHRCKVQFYAVVDRHSGATRNELRLLGYRAIRARFVPVPLDARGWLWVEPMRLWLAVEKDRAICYDADSNRIAPPNERANRAEAEARAARSAQMQALATAQKAEREKADLQKRIDELEQQSRRGRNGK